MPPKVSEKKFKQKKTDVNSMVDLYRGLDDDQISEELNELTNMLYALLLATDCLSFEVMFGRDVSLFIELKEKVQDVH